MEMRIVLCVVVAAVAVVAVEARSPPVARCREYCRYGFVPGTRCECNVRPGSLCRVDRCKLGERCVVRGSRAICIPRRPSRVCYQPKVVGFCKAYIPRFFYNRKTGRCERFIYGGCGANGNNFKTIQECNRVCPSRPRPSRY